MACNWTMIITGTAEGLTALSQRLNESAFASQDNAEIVAIRFDESEWGKLLAPEPTIYFHRAFPGKIGQILLGKLRLSGRSEGRPPVDLAELLSKLFRVDVNVYVEIDKRVYEEWEHHGGRSRRASAGEILKHDPWRRPWVTDPLQTWHTIVPAADALEKDGTTKEG